MTNCFLSKSPGTIYNRFTVAAEKIEQKYFNFEAEKMSNPLCSKEKGTRGSLYFLDLQNLQSSK